MSKTPLIQRPHSPRASHDSDDSLRDLELTEGPSFVASRPRSLSGTFQFQSEILPLETSLSEPVALTAGDLSEKKRIGLVKGIALCVGLQIGSGIFSSPSIIVAETRSVGASLVVWLAASILAWTGASSYAELGASIPVNGGAQAYLAYAYGPLMSYLFIWGTMALKPGTIAVISLVFSEYLNRIVFHATAPDEIPQWAIQVTAIAAVLLILFLCVATPSLGTQAAVVFTIFKITALTLVCALGLIQLVRRQTPEPLGETLFENSSKSPTSYALACYSGLWAFDGWDQANYVGGEIVNPEKNIPRVIHCSMAIVTVLFMMANVAYFSVLDKATVGKSNTVALDFGRALFGPIGGILFAILVAVSCFGAMNGAFFTTSRLFYIAGKEGYLPSMFGRLNMSLKTPLNAMLLQTAVTITFISMGAGFRSLINFAVVASWMAYFLTVFGLILLRVKEPLLVRPYKTWITTPLLFCAVALFLLCIPIFAAPLPSLCVMGFLLLGIPVYYITRHKEEMPRALVLFSNWLARIRGGRNMGPGWQRVATDGDEQLDIVGGRAYS